MVKHLGSTFTRKKKPTQKSLIYSLADFAKLISRNDGQKVTRGVPSDRCSRKQFTSVFWGEKSHHNICRKQLLSFLANKTEVIPHISTLVFILLLASKTYPWITLHFLDLDIQKKQQKHSTIMGFHSSNTKTNSDINRKRSPADVTKSSFAKHGRVDFAPICTLFTIHLSKSITIVDLMSRALYVWFSTVTEQTESPTHRKTTQTFHIREVAPLPPKNSSAPSPLQSQSSFYKASIILWKLVQSRLAARFLFSLVKHETMLPAGLQSRTMTCWFILPSSGRWQTGQESRLAELCSNRVFNKKH